MLYMRLIGERSEQYVEPWDTEEPFVVEDRPFANAPGLGTSGRGKHLRIDSLSQADRLLEKLRADPVMAHAVLLSVLQRSDGEVKILVREKPEDVGNREDLLERISEGVLKSILCPPIGCGETTVKLGVYREEGNEDIVSDGDLDEENDGMVEEASDAEFDEVLYGEEAPRQLQVQTLDTEIFHIIGRTETFTELFYFSEERKRERLRTTIDIKLCADFLVDEPSFGKFASDIWKAMSHMRCIEGVHFEGCPSYNLDDLRDLTFTCGDLSLSGVSNVRGLSRLPIDLFPRVTSLYLEKNESAQEGSMTKFLSSLQSSETLWSLSLSGHYDPFSYPRRRLSAEEVALFCSITAESCVRRLGSFEFDSETLEKSFQVLPCCTDLSIDNCLTTPNGWKTLYKKLTNASSLEGVDLMGMAVAEDRLSPTETTNLLRGLIDLFQRSVNLVRIGKVSFCDGTIEEKIEEKTVAQISDLIALNRLRKLAQDNVLIAPGAISQLLVRSQTLLQMDPSKRSRYGKRSTGIMAPIDGLYYILRNHTCLQTEISDYATRFCYRRLLEEGEARGIITHKQLEDMLLLKEELANAHTHLGGLEAKPGSS